MHVFSIYPNNSTSNERCEREEDDGVRVITIHNIFIKKTSRSINNFEH